MIATRSTWVFARNVADDLLVVGGAVEVVDARQVDEFDHRAAEQHARGEEVDGDAGPVADARRGARHPVEERRLAGVRHADQRDPLHRGRRSAMDEDRAGVAPPDSD